MKTAKSQVTSFLRETVIVVIGVLIALFVSNWKEEASNRAFINKTLYAIQEEIQQSKTDVEEVIQRHYMVIDSIQTYIDDDTLSLIQIIEQAGGIQSPSIKNIGLRFFIANKAELVEYETISRLSEIELTNEMLSIKMDKLLDFAYEKMESTDATSKRQFIVHLSNVIDSEEDLLDEYETFLESEALLP